jgi:acyl-CoA synthetase (AMP-forming)/AMP-acid ligase II
MRRHCEARAGEVLYRYLPTGEGAAEEWTFGEVDRRARAVAAVLLARGARGERVVLTQAAGPAFAAAFLGCLYAGAVAVPTFPPRAGSQKRLVERLAGVVKSARPVLVTVTADAIERVGEALHAAGIEGIEMLATDTVDLAAAEAWREPRIDADALACIQYTSGTSGEPKGVMLTHGALADNSRQIAKCFGHNARSRGVIWLPPHHDMGLVGGILQPLFVGFEVMLMPAAAFLQKPLRWLSAIGKYGGTISGGPCFAYGLCCDAISDEAAAGLDLSSWEVAFVGAEPVRAAVMERFAAKFAASGFRRGAVLACYGLAEATLIVSGAKRGEGLRTAEGYASCGPAVEGTEVRVVDGERGAALGEGHIGEVWVRTTSAGKGYWEQREASAAVFDGRLGAAGGYLRTGDLGFLRDGELFVTGRLKDLIIVRGVNHFPDDLEHTAQASHEALQAGAGVAFAVEGENGERAVLVQELRRESRRAEPEEIVRAIRGAVAEGHDLELAGVVLVRPGTVPRTTSGKVRRSACRELLIKGELPVVHVWRAGESQHAEAPLSDTHAAGGSLEERVTRWLVAKLAGVLQMAPEQIDAAEPMAAYGIGSADGVGLAGQISEELCVDLPAMALWDYPTIAELSRHLIDECGLRALPGNSHE